VAELRKENTIFIRLPLRPQRRVHHNALQRRQFRIVVSRAYTCKQTLSFARLRWHCDRHLTLPKCVHEKPEKKEVKNRFMGAVQSFSFDFFHVFLSTVYSTNKACESHVINGL
jgi:hypothetical protein